MTTVNFWLGEKGGVGKSFGCRTFIEYHIAKNVAFVAFDTDHCGYGIWHFYQDICEVRRPTDSETLNQYLTKILGAFELAKEKTFIVDCVPQSFHTIQDWLGKNRLLENTTEKKLSLKFWFVVDGWRPSRENLKRSLKELGKQIPHIIVRNHGKTPKLDMAWEGFQDDAELQTLIQNHQCTTIVLPTFHGSSELRLMSSKSLSFGQALKHEDFKSFSRARIKKYLTEAYVQFNNAL